MKGPLNQVQGSREGESEKEEGPGVRGVSTCPTGSPRQEQRERSPSQAHGWAFACSKAAQGTHTLWVQTHLVWDPGGPWALSDARRSTSPF